MKSKGIKYEESDFGTRAILSAPVNAETIAELLVRRPKEIELNTSKGWAGTNIEFLRSLVWVESLIVIDMSIDNDEPIQDLTGLRNLELITYCDTEIEFSKFPRLVSCSIQWRKRAASLFDCGALKSLFVDGYDEKSSAPFGKLTNLEELAILNAPLTEVKGLKNLRKLRKLRLANLRKLVALEGIEDLGGLQQLEIQSCKSIKKIDQISNLRNLEILNISDLGDVQSISPMAGLDKLKAALFYESTNVLDGDISAVFNNTSRPAAYFQNRNHYSHKMKDFEDRNARWDAEISSKTV